MTYWKSLAIALAIMLAISYVGFAYVYSQNGGILVTGIGSAGPQPKVVTLLKSSNITLLAGRSWNTSVEVPLGYKTGILYCEIFKQSEFIPPTDTISWPWFIESINVWFETDGIQGGEISLFRYFRSGDRGAEKFEIIGGQIWISAGPSVPGAGSSPYQVGTFWAVVSMSLYLRD